MVRTQPVLFLTAALTACAPGAGQRAPIESVASSRARPTLREDECTGARVSFERSPGGVPEVGASWVRDHHCSVRVVDVRDEEEVVGPLGQLNFAEHVALGGLADAAERWDPLQPVVLVCRSGRRSARATRLLEDMGFVSVASMTGGMLTWRDRGWPVARPSRALSATAAPDAVAHGSGPLTQADIERHVGDPRRVRWVKVAALMLQGSRSCVDGRDAHGVVGTPGGDAGELVLALAAAESLRDQALDASEIGPLVDAFLDAFGRFYVHTDRHALETLGQTLRGDPRFEALLPAGDPLAVERLVRRPPRALERDLLDALTSPEHVGCGHLRLILANPDEYGVRAGLTDALLEAVFQRLWRGDAIDFVVLDGEHEEGAVVSVVPDRPVRPFTRVPMIAPRAGGRELFVNHPEVSAYLRRQTVRFLMDQDPLLASVDEGAFFDSIETLAARQLSATVHHLAARLPIYEVHVNERTFRVTAAAAAEDSTADVTPRPRGIPRREP